MRKYLDRVLCAATTAAVALLGSVGPVQAAIYSGSWEPVFGTPFEGLAGPPQWDLRWEGTYSVSANCPTTGSGDLSYCSPASATVLAATVTLFRPNYGSTTIDFSSAGMTISDVFWENNPKNVISKLETNVSNFLPAPSSSDTVLDAALAPYNFALQFYLDGSGSPGSMGVFQPIPGYSGPVLYALSKDGNSAFRANVNGGGKYLPVFTGLFRLPDSQIPEPSALALVAGALFAAGLVGHRRRAKH